MCVPLAAASRGAADISAIYGCQCAGAGLDRPVRSHPTDLFRGDPAPFLKAIHDGAGELVRVPRADNLLVARENAANVGIICADNRSTAGHGFQDAVGKSLSYRSDQKQVTRGDDLRNVAPAPDKPDEWL